MSKFCEDCGKQTNGAAFCGDCGTAGSGASAPLAAVVSTPVNDPVSTTTVTVPTGNFLATLRVTFGDQTTKEKIMFTAGLLMCVITFTGALTIPLGPCHDVSGTDTHTLEETTPWVCCVTEETVRDDVLMCETTVAGFMAVVEPCDTLVAYYQTVGALSAFVEIPLKIVTLLPSKRIHRANVVFNIGGSIALVGIMARQFTIGSACVDSGASASLYTMTATDMFGTGLAVYEALTNPSFGISPQ